MKAPGGDGKAEGLGNSGEGESSRPSSDQSTAPLTYLVSTKFILMGMGWMYFLAFYGAYRQNEGLMGSKGIVPSEDSFQNIKDRYGCSTSSNDLLDPNCRRGFVDHPSLFWWIDPTDANMETLLLVGTTLSALCGLGRSNCVTIWLLLWILYFSVVTSANGTAFYQYGWESQLLETGFLCAFLCPSWVWPSEANEHTAASPLVLWLFRWLSFRISIGAGMIKIRGDSCWTQKTCLLYHFETQPIPNPLSFVFHFLPEWMLRRAVDLDLFVQVYTSWFVVLPATKKSGGLVGSATKLSLALVRLGGWIQAAFMFNIALSGNMSMLNHLTILPALACLDDACYPAWIANALLGDNLSSKQQGAGTTTTTRAYRWRWKNPRVWVDGALVLGIVYLSVPVVENLLELDGTHQKMNASFGSFRLVNSYGAFGSVGKQRFEPILSVAYGKDMQQQTNGQQEQQQQDLEWIEIEFPCKPGALDRRPCFCAPYHYRLDWNIWFIGFKPHSHYLNRRESWLYHLLSKILGDKQRNQSNNDNDGENEITAKWWQLLEKTKRQREQPWLDLLDGVSADLLEQKGPPLYAKVDMYHYEMAAPLWDLLPRYLGLRGGGGTLKWWNRTYEEPLLPVVAYDRRRGQLVRAPV